MKSDNVVFHKRGIRRRTGTYFGSIAVESELCSVGVRSNGPLAPGKDKRPWTRVS